MPESDHETERVLEVFQSPASANNGSYQKTISLVVVLISILTYMHLQVQSIGERVREAKDSIHRLDKRTQTDIAKLDTKLQNEISGLRVEAVEKINTVTLAAKKETERTHARLSKYDQWFFWWNTNIPSMDATQNARLNSLERDLYGTPILVPTRKAPRTFTLPQGDE